MDGMHPVPSVVARLQRRAVICALVVFGGLSAAATATPSCSPDRCLVEAKVTGFGARIGTARKPFRAPFPGRIVAWSIKLGKPDKRDADCLTNGCRVGDRVFEGFGGQAKARLVILKPV